MGANYFTDGAALKRMFFVSGSTSDEYYTDSGLKLNIEQLTYMELKRSGYERIVFYDENNKLYCYDDESFDLLNASGSKSGGSRPSLIRRNRGLGMGKHTHAVNGSAQDSAPKNDETTEAEQSGEDENQKWSVGKSSGIKIKNVVRERLHLGVSDVTFVQREICGYIKDDNIKTAVVINDANSFVREFGTSPIHAFTAEFQRLDSRNHNIIVFIYTDDRIPDIYKNGQRNEDNEDNKDNGKHEQFIEIACPNAAELRNLLMYFRVNHGLKIKISELPELALALKQAMMLNEDYIRNKELGERLKAFGTDRLLDVDACYEIIDVKKPDSARKQLDSLIGMQKVKDAMSKYDVSGESYDDKKLSVFEYLTASRLQPNKVVPDEKNEMIHLALLGNPGTGKTTAAKLIGQIFFEMGYLEDGHVVETDRSELVAGFVGQTAILTRQKVEEALGGVLFIDEAYSLKRQKDTGNDFGQEAIDTLCKLMDQYKGKFIVVAAGYPREMETFMASNSGLASRFTEIHIDDYTPDEMRKILCFHARKKNAIFSEELDSKLPDFCENWVNLAGENWGNAREAVKLIEAMMRAWKNDPEKETVTREDGVEYSVLNINHIPDENRAYLKPVAEMRAEALNHLNQMTGLRSVKATVEKLRRRMLAGDMKYPGHYMFTGNPGTGKTTVARYMGQILRNLGMLKRGHVVEYTAKGLESAVFNSENNGDFFKVAENALDGVLFIDEAHQLAQTPLGNNILHALLPFMENHKNQICVIAAGYEDGMDDILKFDPGFKSRFTENIYFENYSGAELHEILLRMLEDEGISADDDYKEYSLRALTRYLKIHGKEEDFGNARYVRTDFLPSCLDAQNNRLIDMYGDDFPREMKKVLTGKDIPADMIRFTKTPLAKSDSRSAMDEIDELIGFGEVKEKLLDLLALKKAAEEQDRPELLEDLNFHWVLRGNPGTGKTTVAKLIGKVYKEMGLLSRGHTNKVTRTNLVADFIGQTAGKTQKCIDRAMGGVLFIDEAYMLKRTEDTGNDFGQESIDTILEQMSDKNGEFAVIAAGYPKEMQIFLDSNPGFTSRFGEDILLEDYTADELLKIFEIKCNSKKFYIDDDMRVLVKQLFENMISARIKNWANGREAENLERDMKKQWAKNPFSRLDEATGEKRSYYTAEHIPKKYKIYLPTEDDTSETLPEEKEESPEFSLPVEKLALVEEGFSFEDESYLEQSASVVFISAKSAKGTSSGSGSIISTDGCILTCNHVISDCPYIRVRLKLEKNGKTETKWEKAKVAWRDPDLDAAILKIADGEYHALPLRVMDVKTRTGESIYHWGYPFGGGLSDNLDELAPSFFKGSISSIQTKNGIERINTNMEAKRGCSGGPVFSGKDGAIIGILCGSQLDGDERLMEEINYVLPVKYLWENVISKSSENTAEE